MPLGSPVSGASSRERYGKVKSVYSPKLPRLTIRGAGPRLLIPALVLALFPGLATAHPGHMVPVHGARSGVSECVCSAISESGGWCDHCGVGYIASLRIPSSDLYDMVDPHGHEIDPSGISCPACLDALKHDGYCHRCRIGYVMGQAYMSRLAYLLGLGDSAPIEDLAREVDRLRTALSYLDRCEACAVAAFTDGRCPVCDVYYRDGEPVPGPRAEGQTGAVAEVRRGIR